MTYYDREDQFLRQRLQKEIPILTALIKNLYGELDKKFHLIKWRKQYAIVVFNRNQIAYIDNV